MTTRWSGYVSAARYRSPTTVKTLANISTRAYALSTVRWRTYPDFLIIGTKRGGTTSLWNHLVHHPQVAPMVPSARGIKSNAYFFENLHRGDRWYRSHFLSSVARRRQERRLDRVVTGEASPYYMYGPHVPARIAGVMPDARIIVLLRDPVDRAYGHYQERRLQGVEPLSFGAALEAEDERLAGEWQRMRSRPEYYSQAHDFYAYRDRGIYLPQMRRVLDAFPRDQVLILRSEDLYEDPRQVVDAACAFLGIRPRRVRGVEHHNYIERDPMDAAVERELTAFYAPHNARLYEFLDRDFGWRS